jgi:hypothetical protein
LAECRRSGWARTTVPSDHVLCVLRRFRAISSGSPAMVFPIPPVAVACGAIRSVHDRANRRRSLRASCSVPSWFLPSPLVSCRRVVSAFAVLQAADVPMFEWARRQAGVADGQAPQMACCVCLIEYKYLNGKDKETARWWAVSRSRRTGVAGRGERRTPMRAAGVRRR